MNEHDIRVVSVGSVGLSFSVIPEELEKAKKIIRAAIKETPNRWSKLTLATE